MISSNVRAACSEQNHDELWDDAELQSSLLSRTSATVHGASAVLCLPDGFQGAWFSGLVTNAGPGGGSLAVVASQRLDQDGCMLPPDGSVLEFDVGLVLSGVGDERGQEAVIPSVMMTGGTLCSLLSEEWPQTDDGAAVSPDTAVERNCAGPCAGPGTTGPIVHFIPNLATSGLAALAIARTLFPELAQQYSAAQAGRVGGNTTVNEESCRAFTIVQGAFTAVHLTWRERPVGATVPSQGTVAEILSRPPPEHVVSMLEHTVAPAWRSQAPHGSSATDLPLTAGHAQSGHASSASSAAGSTSSTSAWIDVRRSRAGKGTLADTLLDNSGPR